MLIAISPVVFILIGALMWAFCANPKLQKMGEWTFAVGVFWLGYTLLGQKFQLLGSGH